MWWNIYYCSKGQLDKLLSDSLPFIPKSFKGFGGFTVVLCLNLKYKIAHQLKQNCMNKYNFQNGDYTE